MASFQELVFCKEKQHRAKNLSACVDEIFVCEKDIILK
jgi:hypothetical protein